MDIAEIKKTVKENAPRIKELGNWAEYISINSLIDRVPDTNKTAPGFDAGIACALDLIPRDKQKLSATLHAAYTPKAVEQVRKEIKIIKGLLEDPYISKIRSNGNYFDVDRKLFGLETFWWLLGCSICSESNVYDVLFKQQVRSFIEATELESLHFIDTELKAVINDIENSFFVVDNIPFATKDGGMQGAYISGYPFSVGAGYGVWFVGTYYDSLGIPDDFLWSDKVDDQGRKCSGPVHGSRQFVKCSNLDELARVVKCATVYLGCSRVA